MSVIVFGNYQMTGDEGDSFEVGHAPLLDGYEGFYDYTEHGKVGDRLFFVVTDDALDSASENAFRSPQSFRDLLHSAPLVTGSVVEWVAGAARCRVERRERFDDLFERKDDPPSSDGLLDVFHDHERYWRLTREEFERTGRPQSRWGPLRPSSLPSISAVRESLERGPVATTRRWDTTLLLESLPGKQVVRVVVHGAYDIDSSRIYDIVDAGGYRAMIEERVTGAPDEREKRFWSSLLE